jgi:2,3-bisphosphoglycerate-independent phosphoglycerate mutase
MVIVSELNLNPLKGYSPFPGPLVFVIMDGVALGPEVESNGVHMAYTPVLDNLVQEPLFTKLKAHGSAVGMPSDDDMGNSEVGHNALGAGRVFSQGAKLVGEAVQSGTMFEGASWKKLLERAHGGGALHFITLLSDGNVHSHISHLLAILDRCAQDGVKTVRCHTLLDGRDVGAKSALDYVEPLEAKLAALNEGDRDYRIASGGGRMLTTMDRYGADWSIVERGWKTHALGDARHFASATEAIETFRAEDPDVIDQYLPNFVIAEDGDPIGPVVDGDGVVCLNFRGDRAIQISQAFGDAEFNEFDRQRVPDVFYAGIMQYDGDLQIPVNFLVQPPAIDRPLAHYTCAQGVSAYAISETQKYGHVTYFWNGNRSGYVDEKLETYQELRSDLVPSNERPFMKAAEITDYLIETIKGGQHKFVRANYPNGDMVGHTGVPIAVRISVEAVDLCLARLLPVIEAAKGMAVITADHGNADCMWTEKNGVRSPHMAHTLNPVPFTIKDYNGANAWSMSDVANGGLSNVASTLLNLLGYEAPEDYDPSLVRLG